jgi:6-phosphogluconate dehydrogenase
MKDGLGMTHKEMGDVFKQWNSGVLDSYLIDITTEIVSSPLNI